MSDQPSDPSRASANAPTDLTGREVGDYRILRRLGSGGMAEVYLAEQRSLGRQVALKVLNTALASDASYVQRFQNEARAAASLVHPNIVQIFEVGQVGDLHFIAQEYVAGTNLGQLLQRQGAFEPALVLDILRQTVSALRKAHELGIVHRDIKPENLLLSHAGEVKVADFGLARVQNTDTKTLTQVGIAMGTPLYMSPEQVEGGPVDVRSDIYSLGVTCYHLLAGVPPHQGETALAIAVQHLHTTPDALENVRPDIPSALAALIHKMFAKKPELRPATPRELLVELRALASTAAEEGWAAGPEGWSLSEWIATEPARKSSQLEQLMQAEARLSLAGSRRWLGSRSVLVGAALVGVLLAAVTRPPWYLARGAEVSEAIPAQPSAWAQLYYAQMSATEVAWKKAIEFPDADPFVQQIARRGLVRHYLLIEQDWPQAIAQIEKLELEGSSELLKAFSAASRSVCYQQLGEPIEAQAAARKIDRVALNLLREEEPQIFRLFEASVQQANGSQRNGPQRNGSE